jgi:hypothetical protein
MVLRRQHLSGEGEYQSFCPDSSSAINAGEEHGLDRISVMHNHISTSSPNETNPMDIERKVQFRKYLSGAPSTFLVFIRRYMP